MSLRNAPFVMRSLEMLESPAFRSLTPGAHQILARIEVEHMRQHGQDNGRLQVSFRDFEAYGCGSHKRIAASIQDAVAQGFLVITTRGNWNRGKGRASRYRLTYLPTKEGLATDDWRSRFQNDSMHHLRNGSMQPF